MKFFSKVVFLCNLCFVAFIVLRQLGNGSDVTGNKEAIAPLPALEGTLVVLGVASVLINFIFIIVCGIFLLVKKQIPVARWLVWVNLLFLLLQFIYFKLYR
jgi:hypothetical protein